MQVNEESIDPRHLLVKVAEILEGLKVPYIVTGGMAVFVWGKPRFTADIDIVIQLRRESINALAKALDSLSEMSYIDTQMMRKALMRNGEFNFIDGASGVKVDFFISGDDDFEQSKLKRRLKRPILGYGVYFISAEDLILNKLLWYRQGESSKQLEDIESIIKIQKKLDWQYMRKWAEQLSTADILKKFEKNSA